MGHKMRALGVLLLISCSYSYIIESDDPTESILWPTEYHLKGEKTDLSVGLVEPFEIWYSAELNRSRKDVYEGLDKTFYYSETDETTGKVYKVYPEANEDLEYADLCREDKHKGDIVDFLPKIDEYVYSGEEKYNEKVVQVWKFESSDSDGDTNSVLYVYRNDDGVDIPVRNETKRYNEWTKALTTHIIIYYYDFKLPNEDDLDVSNIEACEDKKIKRNTKKHKKNGISSEVSRAFHKYKHQHKKQYKNKEHKMRKAIFEKNWRKVIAHNRKNLSYKLSINQFSDRTEEELKHLTATSPSPHGVGSVDFPHTEEELTTIVADLPENFDMRLDGVISHIKNQGSCGSCWAFSTTAAVEGALARNNGGRNLDLSEQSLIDCAWSYNNGGCDGGFLDGAFKYIVEHGIPSQREYGTYLAEDGHCAVKNMSEVLKVKGFARVPPRSINAMKYALYKYGPVSVAIYAGDSFVQYSSGIFYDIECTDQPRINHGVTVVGYGVRDDTTYWIVKNSWGEDWGQDGYALMSATNDNCNTLTEAYYPVV
ncbi:uncharacterized protein [Epargyreus clarus]|uniref:uncharacterized protein n=1 Tax=Epargyreus clarus TaxID=520877 RepID=UPI003C302EA0